MRFVLLVLVGFANACSSSSKSTSTTDGGSTTTSTISTATATSTTTTTSTSDTGLTLYGTPYAHVNMWYGPVTYVPGITNACASEPTEIYPTVIQNLYGDYIIGLDGVNIPNVASHCDQCAQLTANGISIVAHIVTYGTENGVDAIDLSPQAQSALGLSSSDWTGTWQFSSCPTTAPVYYESMRASGARRTFGMCGFGCATHVCRFGRWRPTWPTAVGSRPRSKAMARGNRNPAWIFRRGCRSA